MRRTVVAALFALCFQAYGWVDTGHMVIAAIAYHHLTPKARAEADRLLKIGGTPETSNFLTAACWADDVRRDRRETGPWHYVDNHFRSDGQPDANKPEAENVVWALHKFVPVLADKTKPDAERAEALRWVLHFVGDVHQPLHAVSRDTPEHPDGDAGGNRFRIQPPVSMANIDRPPHNLHVVWDLGGGLFPSSGRDFRPLSAQNRSLMEGIAVQVETAHPMSRSPAARDLKPEDWAQESFTLAKTVVYDLPEGSQPSEAYLAKAREVSSERAALAGYRLAEVLNRALN